MRFGYVVCVFIQSSLGPTLRWAGGGGVGGQSEKGRDYAHARVCCTELALISCDICFVPRLHRVTVFCCFSVVNEVGGEYYTPVPFELSHLRCVPQCDLPSSSCSILPVTSRHTTEHRLFYTLYY
uniref:Uncharacterized protein n=1 Tax=Trypanosoma vivax (strain Y486) TaxID=1055687 RepID=G0TWL9_TRYVY|nr:hypothetical protein TVY486_0601480 [Trypanosoma vivax Y486]